MVKKNSIFNENFKILKKAEGLNLIKIEELTSISISSLKQYEFCDVIPSLKNTKLIANIFNVSLDFLIFGDKNNFVQYLTLFNLAEKIELLPTMLKNNIEDSLSHYISKALNKKSILDKNDNIMLYDFTNSINHNIREIREKNKLTQKELATYLGLAHGSAISNYEKHTIPPYETLLILSKKFSISLNYIATGNPLIFSLRNPDFKDNLLKFDKTANIQDIQTITNLMKKILENNNIK